MEGIGNNKRPTLRALNAVEHATFARLGLIRTSLYSKREQQHCTAVVNNDVQWLYVEPDSKHELAQMAHELAPGQQRHSPARLSSAYFLERSSSWYQYHHRRCGSVASLYLLVSFSCSLHHAPCYAQ
jgi:hypothetical protein